MRIDNNNSNFMDNMNNNQINDHNYNNIINTNMIKNMVKINNNNVINKNSSINLNNENSFVENSNKNDTNFSLYYPNDIQTMKVIREKIPDVITSGGNGPKVIQEGNFKKDQIHKIKNIINSYKVTVEMISQKLKEKIGGDWFVLSYKQDQDAKIEDFDFKFTNNKIEDVFIFSENKYKYYICKL